ncbi:MAG: recombinase family protein [Firmicutes bacterium]|nr:recombinase family protein [Bacillota bacterium]HHY33910.1 recombinase family protein [Bacillota bacterium]
MVILRKRAAILARVSTEDQVEGTSLDTQVEICMAEAQKRGYHITPADVFKEDGYSGALGINDRPILRNLWEKYQAGEYDAIFLYRQDRLARSVAILSALRDEALKPRRCGTKGEGFIFVQGGFEDTPEGRLFSNIQGSFAEYEREVIRLRTLTGKKKRAQEGKFFGTAELFGYQWNKEKQRWEIVEEEAKIVRLIYNWYVYGDGKSGPMGTVRVAEKLTQLGIPTPSQFRGVHRGKKGKPVTQWSETTVQRILTHTAYKGTNYFWRGDSIPVSQERVERAKAANSKDGWYAVDFPVIIDPLLWEKAQEKRVGARGGFNRKYPKPLLAGRINCGLCQHAYGIGYYNTGKTLVFKCNGRLKKNHLDGSPRCTSPILNGEALTEEVKSRIVKLLRSPEQMRTAIEEYVETLERRKEELETLLSPINEQLFQIQEKQRRLANVYLNGILSDEDYNRQQNELKEQELAIRQRYEQYSPEIDTIHKLEQNVAAVREAIEAEQFDVIYQPEEAAVTEELAFAIIRSRDPLRLTLGFPQKIMSWEELFDRLQIKLWVYQDRIEVRGIVPIEDIANPKCC